MRAHIIENGVIVNTIEVEDLNSINNFFLIDASLGGRIGDKYEGGEFISQAPYNVVDTTMVDAERDKRISAGFTFKGVRYQSRLPSNGHSGDWDVFSGKALDAFIAVSQGAQPNDLRWSDPNSDFSWIAADNSRVPMDAPTVIELCRAASTHRSKHIFAGSDIKAMTPIPVDFADDKWWP